MAIRRLGQIFVDLGFITDDQLETLLNEQQQQPGVLLGKVAENQGLVNDEQLAQALAEQWNMQVIHLGDTVIPLSAQEDARWSKAMEPLFDEYVKEKTAKGLPAAEALAWCRARLKELQP